MNKLLPLRQKWHSLVLWTSTVVLLMVFSGLQLGTLIGDSHDGKEKAAVHVAQRPDQSTPAAPAAAWPAPAAPDDAVPDVQPPTF